MSKSLVSDGEDLRRLPLSMRKASLARLLARRVDGIFLSDFEQGEIGWIKVKNRQHPAFSRVADQF
jgi:hypothetical protein